MDLQTMFNLVSAKSYYSRSDVEVWHAISNASSTLFQKIVTENRGFFISWNTSLQLVANTEEYALPADCSQLIRMRERSSSSEPWRIMDPAEDLNDPTFADAQFSSLLNCGGPVSPFEYYGPYLTMTDAKTTAQLERFRVAPVPADVRSLELVYVARFIEITSADSTKSLPTEADDCVIFSAVGQLLDDNGDDGSKAAAQAAINEREFLKWVRNRQFQAQRTVTPYLDDLD
jgi:hypothetical protein